MKILNGAEIAAYMKENQAHVVRSLRAKKIFPKLVIIRDSNNPVIAKYVQLKKEYGEDIGVEVEDWYREDVDIAIEKANSDASIHGIIVQLPLKNSKSIDDILAKIAPEKDVDGLATEARLTNGEKMKFESATATAINWLLAGYDIDLTRSRIALVGYGRLIGRPLSRMWSDSGYDIAVFRRADDLSKLKEFDIIITATGEPRLIKDNMVAIGAVVVDAGTASEGGVLVGDVDEAVRERSDLTAITPKIGGVGPLTVTALFEHILIVARKTMKL